MIDIAKLENVKLQGDRIQAGCPACFLLGADKKKQHLAVFKDNRFSCVVFPSDRHHNKQILDLVGTGENLSSEIIPEQEPKIEIERIYDISLLDKLVKDYSYWNGRGISTETIEEFRGGIATEGQMKNRWVFPIFNENEEIIGFTGRALSPEMQIKWKHVSSKSKWIFGGLDEIQTTKRIILVESIGDYLNCKEYGINDILVLFGTNLSPALLGKIISLNPNEIIISTNNDTKEHQAGQSGATKIYEKISKFFNEDKIKTILPIAKDWGEEIPENIKSFLS